MWLQGCLVGRLKAIFVVLMKFQTRLVFLSLSCNDNLTVKEVTFLVWTTTTVLSNSQISVDRRCWLIWYNSSSDSSTGCNSNQRFIHINVLVLTHYSFYSNSYLTGTCMMNTPHNLRLLINRLNCASIFFLCRILDMEKFSPYQGHGYLSLSTL